tara:strand:+ start:672 stop:857 length:186 start_codon:yes stop_codon:yes gene_type:complete
MKTVKLTDKEIKVIMNCLDNLAEDYDDDFITIRDGGRVEGMNSEIHSYIKAISTAYRKLEN